MVIRVDIGLNKVVLRCLPVYGLGVHSCEPALVSDNFQPPNAHEKNKPFIRCGPVGPGFP